MKDNYNHLADTLQQNNAYVFPMKTISFKKSSVSLKVLKSDNGHVLFLGMK